MNNDTILEMMELLVKTEQKRLLIIDRLDKSVRNVTCFGSYLEIMGIATEPEVDRIKELLKDLSERFGV